MVGKGHKIEIINCFFCQWNWAQKTLFCFFGQCINNEIKTNFKFLSLFFYRYKSVLSGSFFVDKTGGGGGGGMGRWVLVGVFDAGNCPKINFKWKWKYH